MSKKCPKCGLYNPPNAERCDCGYDFVTTAVKLSYLPGVKPPTTEVSQFRLLLEVLAVGFSGLGIWATIAAITTGGLSLFLVSL